jgi:hypothetical protein
MNAISPGRAWCHLLARLPNYTSAQFPVAAAAVGGITGALIGMGIPEIEAKQYEGKIRGGNILVAVHVESADARKRAEGPQTRRCARHFVDQRSVGPQENGADRLA